LLLLLLLLLLRLEAERWHAVPIKTRVREQWWELLLHWRKQESLVLRVLLRMMRVLLGVLLGLH